DACRNPSDRDWHGSTDRRQRQQRVFASRKQPDTAIACTIKPRCVWQRGASRDFFLLASIPRAKFHSCKSLVAGSQKCGPRAVHEALKPCLFRPCNLETFLLPRGRCRCLLLARSRFFWGAKPGEEREEGRDFKRYLLGWGGDGHRLGLDQFELIFPRVDFHPAAERKRCDLVDLLGIELRRGGHQRRHPGGVAIEQAVAQVRPNQVLQLRRPGLDRFEEQAGAAELVL